MKSYANDSWDVLIVGGGAAGMVAGITAARAGARTIILEHMDRVGKKILSTGNGKCNYTNSLQGLSYYRGDDPAFVLPVFSQFGWEDTIGFFRELGIEPKCRNGYYYPASEQAASVLEVLRMELDYQKVTIVTQCIISKLESQNSVFQIHSDQGTFLAKKVIVATGLKAAPKSGSDGSSLPMILELGHHISKIVPALVQLTSKQKVFKSLAGIRTKAKVSIFVQGQEMASDLGELQLTEHGVSGIPIFQISRYGTKALEEGKGVNVAIDFLPEQNRQEVEELLKKRFCLYDHNKTAREAMVGLFHKKLSEVLLTEAGIPLDQPAKNLSDKQKNRLANIIKCFPVEITGSKGFDAAQVCAGGISTSEIEAETLESKLVPGLYFAGELIDIDGICGGYNLQWAWSSGFVAGNHAAGKR